MQRTAYAKINWSLDIVGQREDGYHLLDMLMQPVALSDTLTFAPAGALSLTIAGDDALSAGEDNLVLKAARLLQRETGTERGARILLEKRIPSGAGLGGGSSDAATTLHALNAMWGTELSFEALLALGLRLGADVPFCLHRGLCRVQGIGEIVRPISPAPAFPLVIVQPGGGLSTPAVYRAYDDMESAAQPIDGDLVEAALRQGDGHMLADVMGNALQEAACVMHEGIAQCMEALEGLGAIKAQMTGSGSAVIGLFETAEAAEKAGAECKKDWPKTFVTETLASRRRKC